MLNLASGAPEDAKVRDVSCMIVMLYEMYFKSVDDACGALDGSFCIRKPMSKQLAAAGAVGTTLPQSCDGVLPEAIRGVLQTIKNRKAVQNSQLLPQFGT